jgi:hypothetical protein
MKNSKETTRVQCTAPITMHPAPALTANLMTTPHPTASKCRRYWPDPATSTPPKLCIIHQITG